MLDRLATPAHGLWVRIGAHLRAHDPDPATHMTSRVLVFIAGH
jgi:hypothetical protein